MSLRSRFANRHKRKDWNPNLILTQGATMHDTDKAPPDAPTPAQFVTSPLAFLHPPGFEVAGFLIVAIDKQGHPFTNCPPDPSLALHLAQIGTQYAIRQGIAALQSKHPKSPILVAPAGAIPPWNGPAGRG